MKSRISIVLALLLTACLAVDAFGASPEEISTNVIAAIKSGDSVAFARDFTPPLRNTLSPQAVQQLLKQLKSQAGAVVSVGKPLWRAGNTATYPLKFEKDELNLQLTFENGKLGGIYLAPGGSPASAAVVETAAANIETALRESDPGLFVRDFSVELSRSLSKPQVTKIFGDLREKYGALESRGTASHPQPKLAVYPMKFARGDLNLVLTVGADGKIEGIHFAPASLGNR